MSTDEGFFSRWSRRKTQVRSGEPAPEPAPLPAAPAPLHAVVPPVAPLVATDQPPTDAAPAEPPAPTLQDTEALTPASDFSRFVARDVAPDVRNAAVKKLFADPHFNVMDGLDIYIDDYSQPDPLPLELARKLTSAQFMKVFDAPEEAPQTAPQTSTPPDEPPTEQAPPPPADPPTEPTA